VIKLLVGAKDCLLHTIAKLTELLPVSIRPPEEVSEISAVAFLHRRQQVITCIVLHELDFCNHWKAFAELVPILLDVCPQRVILHMLINALIFWIAGID